MKIWSGHLPTIGLSGNLGLYNAACTQYTKVSDKQSIPKITPRIFGKTYVKKNTPWPLFTLIALHTPSFVKIPPVIDQILSDKKMPSPRNMKYVCNKAKELI